MEVHETEHTVNGHTFMGIKDDVAARAVVDAMRDCVKGLEDGTMVGSTRIRRVVSPTTPLRQIAYRLGLREVVRHDDECAKCFGGCHFCCINNGISGADYCFIVFCRGVGRCG